MSAITGVWHFDGRLAEESVRQMTAALAHRGPDAFGTWTSREIGLGNRLLHTTPESIAERQPLVAEGEIVLSADARIDNRSELIRLLDIRYSSALPITDADLILAAYLRWGTASPARLLGDFAFAIWDGRTRSFFCARDPMGVKPFYYILSDRGFAFGSEIKALFALPDVPQRLNELQVAYYLSGILSDREITFFQDVVRLPAASWIRVQRDGTTTRSYWSLADVGDVRYSSDEEYAEAFRQIFQDAVTCRLRSVQAVGSTLSGGMDSSSITCMARDILARDGRAPLQTFSAIFPDLPAADLQLIDERSYVDAVVAMGGIANHRIRADRLSPLFEFQRVFWHQDEAPLAPNLYIHWGLFGTAADVGVRVLLDGIDGDSAVGHGWGRLNDLLQSHQWDEFASEATALATRRNERPAAVLVNYGFPHLERLARDRHWVEWVRAAWALSRRFRVSRRRLLGRQGLQPALAGIGPSRRGAGRSLDPAAFFIAQPFADRIQLAHHWRAQGADRRWSGTERQGHVECLEAPIFQYGLELIDKAAAAFSLEPRYPFFDRRLMEFCVGLPPEQKMAQGWSRLILRRAMTGILPAAVQWRPGKARLSPNLQRQLLRADAHLIEQILQGADGAIGEYVDVMGLKAQYERARTLRERSAFGRIAERLYQPITLALWLDDRHRLMVQ